MKDWRWGHVPILMYHSIADIPGDRLSVSPKAFAGQLAYLHKNGRKTITLEQYAAWRQEGRPIPDRAVILTFDDGYLDNYSNALPLLLQYGMTAAVFPVAGWIGKTNDWENYPGKSFHRMMGWPELRAWLDAGMDMGVHTVTHCSLSSLPDREAIAFELQSSQKAFAEHLQFNPAFLCYPYGDFDNRVKQIAADCGFKGALAILNDTPWFSHDMYAMQRVPVSQRHRLEHFAVKVSAVQPVLTFLQRCERGFRHYVKGS